MAHLSRNHAFAALALLLPLLCACTPPTAETELNWGMDQGAAPRAARTYAYRDTNAVTPKPRPSPAAFTPTPTARCTCDDTVTAAPLPAPSGSASASFAWPLSGPVIAKFGSDVSGARNDGINIATSLGEPIHASASGSIIYSGNELKGYGNLILIKHNDGYVTAYAHAERIIVARGDSVTKGQVIGYAGQTGDVTSPQLHFEIRRGTEPVNPSPLLVASR